MLEKAKRMFLLFWSAGVGECAHAVGAEVASAHLIFSVHKIVFCVVWGPCLPACLDCNLEEGGRQGVRARGFVLPELSKPLVLWYR